MFISQKLQAFHWDMVSLMYIIYGLIHEKWKKGEKKYKGTKLEITKLNLQALLGEARKNTCWIHTLEMHV